jgi:hypothetical protein
MIAIGQLALDALERPEPPAHWRTADEVQSAPQQPPDHEPGRKCCSKADKRPLLDLARDVAYLLPACRYQIAAIPRPVFPSFSRETVEVLSQFLEGRPQRIEVLSHVTLAMGSYSSS